MRVVKAIPNKEILNLLIICILFESLSFKIRLLFVHYMSRNIVTAVDSCIFI